MYPWYCEWIDGRIYVNIYQDWDIGYAHDSKVLWTLASFEPSVTSITDPLSFLSMLMGVRGVEGTNRKVQDEGWMDAKSERERERERKRESKRERDSTRRNFKTSLVFGPSDADSISIFFSMCLFLLLPPLMNKTLTRSHVQSSQLLHAQLVGRAMQESWTQQLDSRVICHVLLSTRPSERWSAVGGHPSSQPSSGRMVVMNTPHPCQPGDGFLIRKSTGEPAPWRCKNRWVMGRSDMTIPEQSSSGRDETAKGPEANIWISDERGVTIAAGSPHFRNWIKITMRHTMPLTP